MSCAFVIFVATINANISENACVQTNIDFDS